MMSAESVLPARAGICTLVSVTCAVSAGTTGRVVGVGATLADGLAEAGADAAGLAEAAVEAAGLAEALAATDAGLGAAALDAGVDATEAVPPQAASIIIAEIA